MSMACSLGLGTVNIFSCCYSESVRENVKLIIRLRIMVTFTFRPKQCLSFKLFLFFKADNPSKMPTSDCVFEDRIYPWYCTLNPDMKARTVKSQRKFKFTFSWERNNNLWSDELSTRWDCAILYCISDKWLTSTTRWHGFKSPVCEI